MFEISIEVKSPFSFGGPFVQKDGKGQFIYLCWGLMAGDTQSRWQRRTKIYLHDLTEDRVSQALATGEQLTLAIQGTGKDGGPACATVPVRLKA